MVASVAVTAAFPSNAKVDPLADGTVLFWPWDVGLESAGFEAATNGPSDKFSVDPVGDSELLHPVKSIANAARKPTANT
jgi:hypothetical protein